MKYSFTLRTFLVWASLVWSLDAASPGGVTGGLQLWLKADAGITTSGSSVSKWEDQTNNNFDANQSSSSRQPTYYDNRANFNPSLYFNHDNLDIPNQNYFISSKLAKLNGKKLTVFVVDKVIGGSSWRSPWTTRNDDPSKGHILYYNNNKYQYWVGDGSSGGWKVLNGTDTTQGYEIVTTTSDESGTEVERYIYQQGKKTAGPMNSAFSPNDEKPFRIGAGRTETNTNIDYHWSGDITEVIVYDTKLSNDDRKQVESYLAIKYGITLTQNKRYFNSSGNIIWNGPNGYRNDIAGLGKDDDSGLDQKISKSINADAIVMMATSSDFTSGNAGRATSLSLDDKRFLIWSNDNGGAIWTEVGAPAGGKILERKWKARKTEDNQYAVSIQVDVNDPDFDLPSFNGSLYFVQGKKDELSEVKPKKMTDGGSGKWYIDGITFSDTNNENYFSFVIPPQTIADANLIINEVLYNEPNSGSHEGEEFIELYAKDGGEIKGMILSDQDKQIEYRFPSNCSVQQGDYVVMHRIDGSQADSCSTGGVSHFYLNNATNTQRLGNGKDDVVLLRPSNSDTTTLADNHLFFAIPVDYISWGSKNTSGSNYDDPPTSDAGVTVNWDSTQNNRLNHEADGQSISLTPNATDNDTSECWEPTATTTAAHKADDCPNYLPTRDTEPDGSLTYSMGENNNGMPDMHIVKTSIVISDPVNDDSNPKRIPGAIVRYCFTVKNTGEGSADNVVIHDTLDGDNKDKLSYIKSGKAAIVTNTNNCTESDCAGISDTSGSYDAGTKKVDIDLDTPFPKDNHQCAYIETEIN